MDKYKDKKRPKSEDASGSSVGREADLTGATSGLEQIKLDPSYIGQPLGDAADFHSGLVVLTGRPNTGKSTLLNRYAGMHLAITSPKPQTTRQVIRAIIDDETSQIIFLDTPGLLSPRSKLDRFMDVSTAAALSDADVVVLMIDAAAATEKDRGPRVPPLERQWLEKAGTMNKPIILVMNKVDKVTKEALLPLMAVYAKVFPFHAIIPISASSGDGTTILFDEIRKLLPAGPRYYPIDSLTDQSEKTLVAELIREQVLLQTHEEIPHGVAVEIESFEELPDADARDLVRIQAAIYCEKDSHKGILIGKQGSMLKKIGTYARKSIEEMTGCPCYLELFVKVREDWRNRQEILRDLGYEARR